MAHALLGGDKPKIPEYPMVNFEGEQMGAIRQNIDAMPELQRLASQVNDFNASEMFDQMKRFFPGYASVLNKGSEIIRSQMKGEIPKDVSDQISRVTAERARAGGYAGSEFADALEARDLGLTSLNLIQNSLSTAERWMQQAAGKTNMFNFASMFVTPQQRIATRVNENASLFQRNLLKERIDALPNKWQQAVINLADNIEEVGQSALSAYAGGAVGGGGGGGQMMSHGAGGGEALAGYNNIPYVPATGDAGMYYRAAGQPYGQGWGY